jgi:hypothetical protein
VRSSVVLTFLRTNDTKVIQIILMVIEDLGAKLGKRVTNIHVVFRFSGKFDISFSILIFSTIHLLGITLEDLSSKVPLIENLLRNNKHVRVLICNPKSHIISEIEWLVVSSNTSQRIEGTLGMLDQMRTNLNETQKNNLELRTYYDIPSHSMIIVDPDTSSSFMQIEPYPQLTAQQYRRIFKISQHDQRNIFELYWNA